MTAKGQIRRWGQRTLWALTVGLVPLLLPFAGAGAGAVPAEALVDHVVHISVDGVNAEMLADLMATDPAGTATWRRLRDEGASTFNARTDVTNTRTLPNHTSMLTARPVDQPAGLPATTHHGWTTNVDPLPGATLHNSGNPDLTYVPSVFDVVHDNGLSAALFASKSKFSLFDVSYDTPNAAADVTGPDNGPDKIDSYVFTENTVALTEAVTTDLATNARDYTFVHFRNPDWAGHGHGWGSPEYLDQLRAVDDHLALILSTIEGDPGLAGTTSVILTSDHGGGVPAADHSDPNGPVNHTIPVFVWGPGVTPGGDLYAMNADRADPGTDHPSHTAPAQPIRNGETGTLALALLGLPPIPGSLMNQPLDLPANRPPAVSLPAEGFLDPPDAPLSVQLEAADPDGQPLTFDLDPGTPLPDGLAMSATGLVTGTASSTGSWDVTVRVTDGTFTTSDTVTWVIDPAAASTVHTVRTDPPGLVITVDNVTSTGASTHTLQPGQRLPVRAPLTQAGLTFVGWTSDRAAEHDIVGGKSPTDVVARYVTTAAPVNAALAGSAQQSSTHTFPACGAHSADKAIDGSIAGLEEDCSVSHTTDDVEGWWQVDLGEPLLIEHVDVFNWTHHSLQRLSDGYVLVSPFPFGDRSLAELLADPSVRATYFSDQLQRPTTFMAGTRGRYVRVQIQGQPRAVVMSEVEVVAGPQRPPVVVAEGPTDPVPPGSPVALNAADSVDPDGTPLTFSWRLQGGDPGGAEFDDPSSAAPVLDTAGVTGAATTALLTVTDADGQTASATLTITFEGVRAVVSDPGGPFVVGDLVTVDASGSSASDGGALTFAWDLDDDGTADDATGATAVLDTTATGRGLHDVTVVASSASLGTSDVAVAQIVVHAPPVVAIADPGGPVEVDTVVALDASASFDPEAGDLVLLWDLDGDGQTDDAAGATADLDTAGLPEGVHTVTLEARSPVSGLATVGTVEVEIVYPPEPPVAALADPGGPHEAGTEVTLDASGSTDPEGGPLTFEWDLTGDDVFDDATGATTAFDTTGLAEGTHPVAVRVTSQASGLVATASGVVAVVEPVIVYTPPEAVLADPGGPFGPGNTIDLTASGTDPEGGDLFFAWDLGSGDFDDAVGETVTIAADDLGPGDHVVRVRVTSSVSGLSDTAERLVVVHGPPSVVLVAPSVATITDDITLDASASTEPQGAALTFYWDVDGDGTVETGLGNGPVVTVPAADLGRGVHHAYVVATSELTGMQGLAIAHIVIHEPPSAEVTGPTAAVTSGTVVTLDASGSHDPEGGLLGYAWDVDGDGAADVTGATVGVDTTGWPVGTREVAVTVTSAASGLTGTATHAIVVTDVPDDNPPTDDGGDPPAPVSPPADDGATPTEEPAPTEDPGDEPLSAAGMADTPIDAAIELSQRLWSTAQRGGDGQAASLVVLSRDDAFADSLTGSALSGDGPLLFTATDALDPATAAEIDRVLAPGGEVLVLGGESAIGPAVTSQLATAGYAVTRLAGPSRVETALAVADELATRRGQPLRVAVARADSPADNPTAAWADSVSAGGWAARTGQPILLTQSATLHTEVEKWLAKRPTAGRLVLGGTSAIADEVAAALGAHDRVGGANRFATAVALAESEWDGINGVVVAAGNLTDGWAYGLASAGLSARTGRPLLLVEHDRLPAETAAATCRPDRVPVDVIGGLTQVSDGVRTALTAPC